MNGSILSTQYAISNSTEPTYSTAAMMLQSFQTQVTNDSSSVLCIKSSIEDFPPDGFTESQRENGAIAIHFLIVIYLCIMLAFVCDDYFVPSLEIITKYFKLNDDVAGATFMAIGTSSPELFSSIIGSFITEGDIGIGTIVGSAVFNLLAVVAVAGIALWNLPAVQIDWYPISRDCAFYAVTVSALVYVIRDNTVTWGEALAFLVLYLVYIVIMYFNHHIEELSHKWIRKVKVQLRKNPVGIESSKQRQHAAINGVISNGNGSIVIQMNGLNRDHLKQNGNTTSNVSTLTPNGGSGRQNYAFYIQQNALPDFELQMRTPTKTDSLAIIRNNSINEESSQNRHLPSERQDEASRSNETQTPVVIESLSDQSECSSQIEADNALNNKLSNGSFEPRLSAQSQQQLIGSVAHGRVNDWNCATQNGLNVKSQQQQDDNSKPMENKSGDDDDDNDQSPPWQLPENITFLSVLWWTIQLPAKTLLLITIPDCRRRGRKNLFFITFTMSCGYIALLTYLCVWMVTIIGYTLRIPDTVAGLTILAAGTSVPELISSVIVVKSGLANMAICNAVGSNIFDILFCLGMPWLIKAAFFSDGQGSLLIQSAALTYTAITLLSTIILLLLIFQVAKWKLSRTVGIQCGILYVVFVVLACLYELNVFGAFNPVNCAK